MKTDSKMIVRAMIKRYVSEYYELSRKSRLTPRDIAKLRELRRVLASVTME